MKGKKASWWAEAKTLQELLSAKTEAVKSQNAHKRLELGKLRKDGLISEADYEKQLRHYGVTLARAESAEILKSAMMAEKTIQEADSGKRSLSKQAADNLAAALGCPPNVVYSLGRSGDEEDAAAKPEDKEKPGIVLEVGTAKRGPRKAPAAATKKSKAGRPKGTGPRQKEAKLISDAALSEKRPIPSDILSGLTRKRALERLSKMAYLAGHLFGFLAKEEPEG